MKIHLSTQAELTSQSANNRREQVRRRQMMTIIFAIVIIAIAGVSSAQSPQTESTEYANASLQYDGATAVPIADPNAVVDQDRVLGGAVAFHRLKGDARPAYVEFGASLSNFDADAEPDGWRADLVLRDRKDRPVVMRAHATFELMPRVSTADHHRLVDADTPPIRWSMPLEFDEDFVARVKLPLRQSLRPMLGWSSAVYRQSDARTRDYGSNVRGLRTRSRKRTVVTLDLRDMIGTPSTGELRVRVSVPTEGVFEAATPVRIRPSVLVDTPWPYR